MAPALASLSPFRPIDWLRVAAVAFAYWAAGKLGMAVGLTPDMSSVVWPAAGVGLAALAWGGDLRLALGVLGGAVVNNLACGMAPLTAVCVAAGSTGAAVAGAVGLRRVHMSPRFDRLHAVAALATVGALGSSVLSATSGMLVLLLTGTAHLEHAPLLWLAWWLGDAMGVLTVAPACLVWGHRPWPRPTRLRALEGAVLAVLLVGLSLGLFAQPIEHDVRLPPLLYLLLPVLLWAAVRFGQRGATLAVLATTVIAISGTAAGYGPFTAGDRVDRLLSLQLFLGILVLTVLILGAVIEERRAAIVLRDEFVLVASHELKTPLTALGLALENLERLSHKDDPVPAMQRKIAMAQQQVTRLVHLAEDMLEVTRIGHQGGMALHRQHCDLADVTDRVIQRLDAASARYGCQVHAELHSAQGSWDVERLEQVITNLLDNAFKYGSGKPVRVHVGAEGGAARLVVEDGGIGIHREDLGRIFDRFGRAVPSNHYGGLGLSLHISRQIVRAHGGSIAVSSQPAQGSCFTVELPTPNR